MSMLQQEFDTYRSQLPTLLASRGEGGYVVIQGQELCDVFPTYESALEWAYERFGLEPFFVKKIARDQCTVHFTRDLGPCRR